jgi:hypothetical protein
VRRRSISGGNGREWSGLNERPSSPARSSPSAQAPASRRGHYSNLQGHRLEPLREQEVGGKAPRQVHNDEGAGGSQHAEPGEDEKTEAKLLITAAVRG